MATLVRDLVEGARIAIGPNGPTVIRKFHVDGVTGAADARQFEAVTADGIPVFGEFDPVVPTARAFTITAEPTGTDSAIVTVEYKRFPASQKPPDETVPPDVQIGSSVQSFEVNTDKDGNPLTVKYTPDDGSRDETEIVAVTNIDLPVTVARLVRRESFSPIRNSVRFTGRVNRTRFLFGGAREWLCRSIDGRTVDGGETYTVSYVFQHNPDKFDKEFVFIDDETGQPPPDIASGIPSGGTSANGRAVHRLYKEDDFGVLAIDIGT